MNVSGCWPTWLQLAVLSLLVLVAALEWFTLGYFGLVVPATGALIALYLRYKNSR